MLYASHMRAAGEAYRTKSFRLANFKKRSNQAIQLWTVKSVRFSVLAISASVRPLPTER